MTGLKILLALLQFANWLFDYLKSRALIKEGEDRAIAEETAQILRKTTYAKETMARISGLDSDDVDKLLRDLERPSSGG